MVFLILYGVFYGVMVIIRFIVMLLYIAYKEFFTKEGYVPSPDAQMYMDIMQRQEEFYRRQRQQ